MLPAEVLGETLEHRERFHHNVAVQGVAAVQHVGLEHVELSHLQRDRCSGKDAPGELLMLRQGARTVIQADPQT